MCQNKGGTGVLRQWTLSGSVIFLFVFILVYLIVLLDSVLTVPVTREPPRHGLVTNSIALPKIINHRIVKLGVIAPADPHHEQSLLKILPAVALAVNAVSLAKGPLPGWTIIVDYRDSKCSSTHGSLAAFDFHINKTAGHFYSLI